MTDTAATSETALDRGLRERAEVHLPKAIEILREAVRLPSDHTERPQAEGGDPLCGLSNHEGPRLEYLRRQILELGAVDSERQVGYDDFGNLYWTLEDPDDGIAAEEKTVIFWDGHVDTVQALRERWRETIGGGIDAYLGLIDEERIDRAFLQQELGYLPPEDQWRHLIWGRGAADQLGGVVCQILASKVLLELRAEGSLRGVVIRSYATVAEEDNDGGGPMFYMREQVSRGAASVPDVVVLTEGTGCAEGGAVGIYRGQRGRMQIEVDVTGKSCHGSMPWEGRNPLEFGGAILAEAAAQYRRRETFAADEFLGAGSRTASWAELETPSDCAVPERFTFRFDRRLTAGEDPAAALRAVEGLASLAVTREAGLEVSVRTPTYDRPTWRGYRPGNPQVYPGWVTPEEHPAIATAALAYRRVVSAAVPAGGGGGALRREPRVSRWVFSTDGVGVPLPLGYGDIEIPESKAWISAGGFRHPAMFGVGPGIEHNTHKIGECVDSRELVPVIAMLARFPSLYREAR